MLNYTSRSLQEHIGLHRSRAVRLLLVFLAVTSVMAATLQPAVLANARERFPRRSAAGTLRPQSRRTRHAARHDAALREAHAHPATAHRTRRSAAHSAHAALQHASDRSPAHESAHESARPRRIRGESHANYLRRVARWNREERHHAVHEELARESAPASSGAFAVGESHPSEADKLASPAALASGPQLSANGPVAVASPSTAMKMQPAGSAREMAEEAVRPKALPLYNREGRLIVPPPLRGSREVLVHQNQMADAAGLERIQDDGQLDQLRSSRRLVLLPSSQSLRVNPELPENRRCARPWTARFAADIARAYFQRFGQPLELNSAVRTISYQLRLQRVNGNAAAITGETASPHLTGQAIDFGKRGMSVAEIAWMRAYLLPLMQSGAIDVEEEFQQSCFHISVYRSYGGESTGVDLAQVTRSAGR